MTKHGYETYEIDVITHDVANIECRLNEILSVIEYDADIISVDIEKETDTTEAEADISIEIRVDCEWRHIDASWGFNGGRTAEDSIIYSETAPNDILSALKSKLNATYAAMRFVDFTER